MEIEKWATEKFGHLNLENIRAQFQPADNYKISCNKYDAGVNFEGEFFVAGLLYVVQGSCRVMILENLCDLHGGEFAELPAGNYRFSVSEYSPVEIISVWKIPKP